jgi:hypothetical protein
VAIVLADSGGSLTVLQQNYGGRRYVTQDSVSKSHLLGYLRPKAL